MVAMDDNIELYIWNFLRAHVRWSDDQNKEKQKSIFTDFMLIRLNLEMISQY
jgi:hypothetical protein